MTILVTISMAAGGSTNESSGEKWTTPDGLGFIELLEVFGNDLTVVNAARVSFHKESYEMTARDEKLIEFLAKHGHDSPFFHPQIRLRVSMPIFVAREWYRHQIGLARNEVSRRYVDEAPKVWVPSRDELRQRDAKLKQGSRENPVEEVEEAHEVIESAMQVALDAYDQLLKLQVAPEIARAVLPQSMYTEFIETGSLAAYARIWKLRTSEGAQREIKQYASAMGELISRKFPVAWAALCKSSEH